MIIKSKLPADRALEGDIYLDGMLLGRARGKADNQRAIDKGNPTRNTTMPFGDHPYGTYRVVEVRDCSAAEMHSYGPHKLVLDPIGGDALAAKQNGRTDLEIHGGDPQSDGVSLRATYGCLRVNNNVIKALALRVKEALARGETVEYVCGV